MTQLISEIKLLTNSTNTWGGKMTMLKLKVVISGPEVFEKIDDAVNILEKHMRDSTPVQEACSVLMSLQKSAIKKGWPENVVYPSRNYSYEIRFFYTDDSGNYTSMLCNHDTAVPVSDLKKGKFGFAVYKINQYGTSAHCEDFQTYAEAEDYKNWEEAGNDTTRTRRN